MTPSLVYGLFIPPYIEAFLLRAGCPHMFDISISGLGNNILREAKSQIV